MQNSRVKILIRISMIVLAVVAVVFTLRRAEAEIWTELRHADLPLLGGAVLLYGIILWLGSIRWEAILRLQNLPLGQKASFRLTLIGVFFSIFIPGAISGDVVKIAFATKKFPDKKTELSLSVLVDRIIGMAGLFFMAAIMMTVCWRQLLEVCQQHRVLQFGCLVILGGCLGIFILWGILLYRRKFHGKSTVRVIVKPLDSHASLVEKIHNCCRRLEYGFVLYASHPIPLLKTCLISCLIHFCHGITLYLLGRALHDVVLGVSQCNLVMQFSNVMSVIPLFPGGIGLRDLTASLLMQAFSGENSYGSCVPVCYTFVVLFWGGVGALAYWNKSHDYQLDNELSCNTK